MGDITMSSVEHSFSEPAEKLKVMAPWMLHRILTDEVAYPKT
jgi:hypothetical protein